MFRVFSILFVFESIARAIRPASRTYTQARRQQGKWCLEIPTNPAFFSAPHAVVFALLLLSEADRLLDREATGAVGTLEIFEAVDGDTRSTSGELQEAGLLLGVPATNDL
jgi:hypothetical protein